MGQVLATNYLPPIIIAFIFGLPSLVLYILEVIILIRHWKQFNSSFFRLFLIRAVPNLLNYFTSYFGTRFGRLGWFYSFYAMLPNFVLALLFFLHYYNFHVENLATMFLLLNRFTSILFPLKHRKIWVYLLPCSVLIVFILPLPVVMPILWRIFFIDYQENEHYFGITYEHVPGAISNSTYAAASAIIFCVVCAILNIAALVAYTRQKIRGKHVSGQIEDQKVEMRLTMYAFLTFVAQLGMAIFMILLSVGTAGSRYLISATLNQLPWLSDLCTLAMPSWLLLWASQKVRQAVLDYLPDVLSTKLNAVLSRNSSVISSITVIRRSSIVSPTIQGVWKP